MNEMEFCELCGTTIENTNVVKPKEQLKIESVAKSKG